MFLNGRNGLIVEKRLLLFLALSMTIIYIQMTISNALRKPPAGQQVQGEPADGAAKDGAGGQAKAEPDAEKKRNGADTVAQPAIVQEGNQSPRENAGPVADSDSPPEPRRWLTIGSLDPQSPYRMLVTLNSAGAAVERVELNSPRYRDLEDETRHGYLGHLALENGPQGKGCVVRMVGPGSPAALAGIQLGDTILSIAGAKVSSEAELHDELRRFRRGESLQIELERDGQSREVSATLAWEPLQLIRPEKHATPVDAIDAEERDPLSLLMTLHQVGGQTLDEKGAELAGVDLRTANWRVTKQNESVAEFTRLLPKLGVEVVKRYELATATEIADPNDRSYHLTVTIEVKNTDEQAKKVAYRLDGPNGLPLEGAWFASKVSRSGADIRTVLAHFDQGNDATEFDCGSIVDQKVEPKVDAQVRFIGIDAQYFAAALVPRPDASDERWFRRVSMVAVGEPPAETAKKKQTNISFRLESKAIDIEPRQSLVHRYELFAGPKKPALLAKYQSSHSSTTLDEFVYYGWFYFVAGPMVSILHGFYRIVSAIGLPSYGLAIIMLTVLVRGCMFPLSRKQALGAQKMAELQPEMQRLKEKYKNNPQEQGKAIQDLFRKYNYNPLGGCMLAFVQLPVFIGLYRALSVDVELRQAPLLGSAIRWCSNLAAPDMLMNWTGFMPQMVVGFLGPYLNVLPLITIALFLWQQKMFMPPATDETQLAQQKMMKYMMIFMGVLFYKVASGLCIYFIASSLWGIAERKILPKTSVAATNSAVVASRAVSAGGNGATKSRRDAAKRRYVRLVTLALDHERPRKSGMLLEPFGTRPAHIMQLRPVAVRQMSHGSTSPSVATRVSARSLPRGLLADSTRASRRHG